MSSCPVLLYCSTYCSHLNESFEIDLHRSRIGSPKSHTDSLCWIYFCLERVAPQYIPTGYLRVAGTPQIVWNLCKFLMIIHVCKLDLELLVSWLKTFSGVAARHSESISMFFLAVRAHSSCCTMADTAAMKNSCRRTYPRRYSLKNGEQELAYGVVNGMEYVSKSPEFTAGIIYL